MSGSDGRTPVDLARRDGHGDLVLLLLLRADPDLDAGAWKSLEKKLVNSGRHV